MTEREWITAAESGPLWQYWQKTHGRERAARKLQLLACACLRRVWHLLPDEHSRHAVEVAERHADGQTTDEEVVAALAGALEAWGAAAEEGHDDVPMALVRALPTAAMSAWHALDGDWQCISGAAYALADSTAPEWEEPWKLTRRKEAEAQARLARCVLGNPFRPPAFDPSWRTEAVVGLASKAYEERSLPAGTLDRDRLGSLADALEGAGCTNGYVLAHCRSEGDHVRGCWVVDLILGRE